MRPAAAVEQHTNMDTMTDYNPQSLEQWKHGVTWLHTCCTCAPLMDNLY